MRSLQNLHVSISLHKPWPGAFSIIGHSLKEDRTFGPMVHVQQTERFEVVVDWPASEGFELVGRRRLGCGGMWIGLWSGGIGISIGWLIGVQRLRLLLRRLHRRLAIRGLLLHAKACLRE